MTTFWNDLPPLEDISNTLKVNTNKFYNTIDCDDLKESIDIFLDEFLNSNIHIYKEYNFNSIVSDYLLETVLITYGNIVLDLNVDINIIINETMYCYFMRNNCPRTYSDSRILKSPNTKKIQNLLEYYKTKEQPDQRTDEWYKFRYGGLTASSIWKAIDSEANRNCLIYKKCCPLKKVSGVNVNSAFHNGHKYEPLSILIYEKKHNTIVGEFGCISHKTHDFLRASPDGINIKPDNPRFGRAVEIKNPISREITGIPKKEYWIQMQLQMEVWDLDECDFLETSFKEYDSFDDFKKNQQAFNKTHDDRLKGAIVMFNDGEEPIYEYAPIHFKKETEFDDWYDNIIETHSHLTWVTNIYWHLEKYSCVLCVRNQKWFNHVFPTLKNTWDTILKERKEGYHHRRPNQKKRKKKKSIKLEDIKETTTKTKELLNLQNSPAIKNNNMIIKIRTQSFEDSNPSS
tara:strand:- start:2464 stop:3837 length:1374 start_codon:yes stop_codon:yes gene_type:complete